VSRNILSPLKFQAEPSTLPVLETEKTVQFLPGLDDDTSLEVTMERTPKIAPRQKPPTGNLRIDVPGKPSKEKPRPKSGQTSPKGQKHKASEDKSGVGYEYVKRMNLRSHMTLMDNTIYSAPANSKLGEVKFRPDANEVHFQVIPDPNYSGSGKRSPGDIDNLIYDVESKKVTGKLLGDYSGLNQRISHFEFGPNSSRLVSIMDRKVYCWGVKKLRPAHRKGSDNCVKSNNWVLNWSESELGLGFNAVTAEGVKDLGKEYTKLFELNGVDFGFEGPDTR